MFDHGLLYGDGVFEGIRFYNGRIFLFTRRSIWTGIYEFGHKAILLNIPIERAALR